MSANQVAAFLQTKLEERATSMRQAFQLADKSNTGFLSPDDFQECLRNFNVRLTRPSLQALIAKYDANGDGYVSYEEFAAVMSGASNAALVNAPAVGAPPSAAERAEQAFRRIIYSQATSVTDAFLKINRNRDGFCHFSELDRVFQSANVMLTPQEMVALLKRVDTNGDGRVDIRELAKILHGDATAFDGQLLRGAARGQKRAR